MDPLNLIPMPLLVDAAVSGLLGFVSGYTAKKAAKLLVLLLGLGLILLGYLQHKGVLSVNYGELQSLGRGVLERLSDLQPALSSILLPIGGSFMLGFVMGLYKG